MSEVKGKLLTCDRCGATCFLTIDQHYTNEGVLNGGYTRWSKLEYRPIGWQYYCDSSIGHLCPNCNAEFEESVKNFMENKTIENVRNVRFEDTL